MNRFIVVPCLAVLLVLSAGTAGASLIGDTINLRTFDGVSIVDNINILIGPGVELPAGGPPVTSFSNIMSIDIAAESIWVQFVVDIEFIPTADWIFSDLDWLDADGQEIPGQIVGITVAGVPTPVLFGADIVIIQFGGLTYKAGDVVHVELDVEHVVVPEPATMTLLGLGLVGYALRRRKMNA